MICPQKLSGYYMDWQMYTFKINLKRGLTESNH